MQEKVDNAFGMLCSARANRECYWCGESEGRCVLLLY